MLIANLPACWGSLSDIFLANLLLYSSFPDFKAVAYGFFLVVEQWRKACLMPCCAVYLGERDVSLVGLEKLGDVEAVAVWQKLSVEACSTNAEHFLLFQCGQCLLQIGEYFGSLCRIVFLACYHYVSAIFEGLER